MPDARLSFREVADTELLIEFRTHSELQKFDDARTLSMFCKVHGAYVDNNFAGYIAIDGAQRELSSLFVLSYYRNLGIANQLLERYSSVADYVCCYEDNAVAFALYQKYGFTEKHKTYHSHTYTTLRKP